MKKDYTIGLDIGTNSVGYSVVTDDYKVISKKMNVFGNTEKKSIKKNFWGVRLFESGQTAQEARTKRTSRRRIARRKNRICYLQEIFQPEMNHLDSNFFYRLNESFLVADDAKYDKHPIFGTLDEEIHFHEQFPTIYHLRKYLADGDEKADLRLVYLAIAHIVKFRGNFLIEGDLNTENNSVIELSKVFVQVYNQTLCELEGFQFIDESIDFSEVLTQQLSKSERADNVLKLFPNEKGTGIFAQFIKLIVGNQGNFKKVFQLEEDQKLQLSADDYEENIENLLAIIGDEYSDIFVAAQNLYQAILLAGILTSTEKTRAKLSASMIQRYEEHAKDLKLLKRFVKEHIPDKYAEIFNDATKNGYAGYIDGKTKEEEFYKYLKTTLVQKSGYQYFIEKIEQENFLRKQRTYDNGVIPHQVHAEELRAILRKQEKYYSFLKENHEKIEQIFKIRIPYYVGPLAKHNEQSRFAWNIRKSDEPIRPWNMNDVVDENASAVAFIERMTIKDIYLNENVLPRHSLIYEKFTVFNELTKVLYADDRGVFQRFSAEEKEDIFEKLFKSERKVTKKKLENYLRNELSISSPSVKGIEEQFNANFGTYLDLKKFDELHPYLDDEKYQDTLEEVIKILTVFEDRSMIQNQLEQLPMNLSTKTIKALSRRKYTGWGRLSARLINGIRDKSSGKTILDYLLEDESDSYIVNRNFMQLINDDHLSFKKIIEDSQPYKEQQTAEEIVSELSGSPAIKKGILQSLKIVDELVAIMGYKPRNIVVEMARENQTTGRGKQNSKPRLKGIENGLKEFSDSVLKGNSIDNKQLQNDRLYLYYLQNGKDMYTGHELDIDQLSNYDIDHIIPQSFLTDNSIDNRVLTTSKLNRGKSDNVPSEEVVAKMDRFWRKLLSAKLISERKYANLTKKELTESDKAGFLKRQLVETRQITKHVATILDSKFNEDSNNRDVQIVTLKSALVSEFRKTFNLYKVREINDLHHAHDAYLNAVVALSLLRVYPQLKPEFVYGEYGKNSIHDQNKATIKKQFYSNITRYFASKDYIINDDGEILWNKQETVAQVIKTLGMHQVNVVKKVEIQKGGFSKESIQAKGESQKLIRRKQQWDTKKYGGFDSPVVAYAILLSFDKGKRKARSFKIVGITIQDRESFEQNPTLYLSKKDYHNPKVEAVLPKYSLFEFENGRRRMVASASETQKGNQLIIPGHLMELLYHSKKIINGKNSDSVSYIQNNKEKFREIFEYIVDFSSKYISADANLKKIEKIFENNFHKASEQEIAKSFINLLTFTAMGAPADFEFFGEKISRKRYVSISEIIDAVFIHQSITGLYETRVRLTEV